METWTAVAIALGLCLALFLPFFIMNVRRGKARGHTWFTWWKPQGIRTSAPMSVPAKLVRAPTMGGARY